MSDIKTTEDMAAQGNHTVLTPPDSEPTDSLNPGSIIVLSALGCVLLLVLIAWLVYRYLHKRSGPIWISKVMDFIASRFAQS